MNGPEKTFTGQEVGCHESGTQKYFFFEGVKGVPLSVRIYSPQLEGPALTIVGNPIVRFAKEDA